MFSIIDDNIRISRGDNSGKFTAVLTDRDGNPYELQQGDVLLLRVKRRTTDEDALIEVTADANAQFEILPQHTENLGCGTYKYDIVLKNGKDNRFHPIWTHDFSVEEVV